MAKKKTSQQIDFPFYEYLQLFLNQERKKIHASFTQLSKKFLAFNNPENPTSYLRKPQYEAIEMYVFLKEYCNNKYLFEIFEDWFKKQNNFVNRSTTGVNSSGQMTLFGASEAFNNEDITTFEEVFKQIKSFQQIYPNYIFALTMGLGKTVLMATSIFYEFLLANKYPKDERYCHNALVFAPDKTVLYSLKEIETFDKSLVIPPEYVTWLDSNLKFHFLDETGDALNAIENSKYNIIISNTQKIILKKQHKAKTPSQELFADDSKSYKAKSLNKDYEDLYGFDIDTDADLITNQRFAKLTRLKQLGIYVDEAHHVFGNALAQDFGLKKSATSLRVTINELAENLKEAGTSVVGCYNYTGTPYVGSRLLPEVVYAYGLRDAINNQYLKKVDIQGFENIKDKTLAFVRLVVSEFWQKYKSKTFEGMLPKLAFFGSTIDEVQSELRPALEQILSELNIPSSKILINVGDSSITTNDDLREFKNLDSPASEKQFIILVNKGKEGWNCRSLFGVALHREPKSKVFVLQATMRCLRAIEPIQQTGMVFLSDENIKILDSELQENFKMSVDDLKKSGVDKQLVEIKIVPPPVKIRFKKVRKLHQLKEKTLKEKIVFDFEKVDFDKYKIIGSHRNIHDISKKISKDKDYSEYKDKREFSVFTLSAEISRYLQLSPILIKSILSKSNEGIEEILSKVNEFSELLYDWIIPKLFNELYELESFEKTEEVEIELVKEPKDKDHYLINARVDLLASIHDSKYTSFKEKSFHLDNYCFDSKPENHLFWTLLNDEKIKKVWFTGMLTHGQSEFVINYIDPVSNTVRSYYPDFLVQLEDGTFTIVEVKGDNMVDDEIVQAKASYANQMAVASNMSYQMLKGSDAMNGVGIN
jgi:type III restriction enzyme